jgi:hypothetical protein
MTPVGVLQEMSRGQKLLNRRKMAERLGMAKIQEITRR